MAHSRHNYYFYIHCQLPNDSIHEEGIMETVQILEHNGKKITYLDFTNCDRKKVAAVLEEIQPAIKSQPPKSVLTLVNVENLVFNAEILKAFQDFTRENKPYVKAGAVLGIKGLQKVAYDAVMRVAERQLPIFDTVDEAKDWLVEQ
jgi:hypothetical protein